jgi:hypothetical protein
MYTPKERDQYFTSIINRLSSSDLIEGIVQLGSGVIGYKDENSDIDLMVAVQALEHVVETKTFVHRGFLELGSVYTKIIELRENIYLIIAFMENGLEFNVSILPRELLSVKSPLFQVVVDKTGEVSDKMNIEHEKFKRKKYSISDDPAFEFMYCMRKFQTELKRQNLIYALKMLETMRDLTLQVEAMNEKKKLHQFKAYETMEPEFISDFLHTYPDEITADTLMLSADRVKELFFERMKRSNTLSFDKSIYKILR